MRMQHKLSHALNLTQESQMEFPCKPIGFIQSVFKYKNGTPRQPMLCENACGILEIEKSVFNNPEHSLEGLEGFTHAWILFWFHKNGKYVYKAKVKPPRLDGRRVGVFSTRSPHRPNPIGLTLAKIDKIQGSKIFLSGIDILDGTPVLDVKPFIPEYDIPNSLSASKVAESLPCSPMSSEDCCVMTTSGSTEDCKPEKELPSCAQECNIKSEPINPSCEHGGDTTKLIETQLTGDPISAENNKQLFKTPGQYVLTSNTTENLSIDLDKESSDCPADIICSDTEVTINRKMAEGLEPCNPVVSSSWISTMQNKLNVQFTSRAEAQMKMFSQNPVDSSHQLSLLQDSSQLRASIISILCEDPRSVYRRQKCPDSLYYFTVDQAHITCWFDHIHVEVVRVQPIQTASAYLPPT